MFHRDAVVVEIANILYEERMPQLYALSKAITSLTTTCSYVLITAVSSKYVTHCASEDGNNSSSRMLFLSFALLALRYS